MPSIRSDLAAPILRRISDDTNYGDEGDTGSLISPSISAHYGITEGTGQSITPFLSPFLFVCTIFDQEKLIIIKSVQSMRFKES